MNAALVRLELTQGREFFSNAVVFTRVAFSWCRAFSRVIWLCLDEESSNDCPAGCVLEQIRDVVMFFILRTIQIADVYIIEL